MILIKIKAIALLLQDEKQSESLQESLEAFTLFRVIFQLLLEFSQLFFFSLVRIGKG
ncbi:hypothetical protein BN1180_01488 [Peribacillus simplex]|uniref:Uncharacterized protein n=1 Tax=Peribacillus simplex TaxID=1478 RepID=A0AAN2TRK5_9BACI|nr:hypothetical protein BN1180_01488 [Peribacillus simplex]